MVPILIMTAIAAGGAAAGWIARRPRRLAAMVLLGALGSSVWLAAVWDTARSPFENQADPERAGKQLAAIVAAVFWLAWSVGVCGGYGLRRLGTARRPMPE